ncbi:GTP cyclohydrolase II [Streptomyces sp. H34-S4]|uniref:GTP cyclohydrolase II n=1 Tax=Streptomyces sp. H34-S4 TaxID=2996463 RepID=UPI00227171BA|nr:GTP cyclohydrolase II [Streptomyces sp. H34-S4]MCY0939674.1 GTP cyclohydrolase II [Streptomyces sp. H34-S4]
MQEVAETSRDTTHLGPLRPRATVRSEVRVPLSFGPGPQLEAQVTTFDGLTDGKEHLALELGVRPADGIPLVRLHSECLTGDVFGSARCDCGPQLHEALRMIDGVGGVLLYLRQEGRGIGLYNKLDAYRLQDDGLDTYEANRALGLGDDLRDYTAAAQMLRTLGISEVDLLTNNPDKSRQLTRHGITVRTTVRTGVFANPHNISYLTAKADRTQHTISLKEKIA